MYDEDDRGDGKAGWESERVRRGGTYEEGCSSLTLGWTHGSQMGDMWQVGLGLVPGVVTVVLRRVVDRLGHGTEE